MTERYLAADPAEITAGPPARAPDASLYMPDLSSFFRSVDHAGHNSGYWHAHAVDIGDDQGGRLANIVLERHLARLASLRFAFD